MPPVSCPGNALAMIIMAYPPFFVDALTVEPTVSPAWALLCPALATCPTRSNHLVAK